MTIKKCKNCEKEFDSNDKRKKFCSASCNREFNRPIYHKVCEICNGEFNTRSKQQRFCSSECGHIGRKKRKKNLHSKICLNCEKEFLTKFSWQKYCCHECSSVYSRKRKILKCIGCGIEFESWEGRDRKYCSQKCPGKYESVSCINCGDEFISLKSKNRKYCSVECQNKYLVGETHPSFKGVFLLHRQIRSRNEYVEIRKQCFKRDGYVSVLSGKGGVIIHHHLFSYSNIVDSFKINLDNWEEYRHVLYDIENVVTLTKKEHELFHKLYRFKNTPEQFNEFKLSRVWEK